MLGVVTIWMDRQIKKLNHHDRSSSLAARSRAADLMDRALLLLDRAGEQLAAARLQHAIDALDDGPDGSCGSAHERRLAGRR